MNFAEAALLIQGSTCVYSKKVHVHLTQQKLDDEYMPNIFNTLVLKRECD